MRALRLCIKLVKYAAVSRAVVGMLFLVTICNYEYNPHPLSLLQSARVVGMAIWLVTVIIRHNDRTSAQRFPPRAP